MTDVIHTVVLHKKQFRCVAGVEKCADILGQLFVVTVLMFSHVDIIFNDAVIDRIPVDIRSEFCIRKCLTCQRKHGGVSSIVRSLGFLCFIIGQTML